MENIHPDTFHGFAKTYGVTYSLCYVVSPLTGLYVRGLGLQLTALCLLAVGAGTLLAIHLRNRFALGLLAFIEVVACVFHFLGLIPWTPSFSDTAYIVMAVLDLLQSICLFRMMNIEI